MSKVGIGIIGCGNISDTYLRGAARSQLVRVKSVADIRADAAAAKAREHSVDAAPVDTLLADPAIEIVVNLTVPAAHAPVNLQIIEAGKHVYLEKPLATRFTDAKPVMLAAAAKGLRVGCAPDTFLGGAHQACRYAIDAGLIGIPVAGAATVLSHGMEHWHPNPA
jgi:predicted dehydrogenase